MDYEKRILNRQKENRQFLKEITKELKGIHNTDSSRKSIHAVKSLPKAKKISTSSISQSTRRSNRLKKIDPVSDKNISHEVESTKNVKETFIKRENTFGSIPDIPVGTSFTTRLEASRAGVHKPPVAGIHGNPSLGCYSIALSGGYEDDTDLGYTFIYTGEGGRDLKGTKANPKNLRTAPQSSDQALTRGNLALSKNIQSGVPVRVLRGYKLKGKFAPKEGYRYDGLYNVMDYAIERGKSGFSVIKFRFERASNQKPAPWTESGMTIPYKKEENEKA